MKNERSEKDLADELLQGMQEEMREHSNLGAYLRALARAKRGVQHRVLDAIKGPIVSGRRRKLMTDEGWLEGVDAWRERMKRKGLADATELEVIRDWLRNTSTRYGRDKGVAFKEDSDDGKREVKRIRDACVRARRSRNKYA